MADHRAHGSRRHGRGVRARRTTGDFEQRVAIKILQRQAISEVERFQIERRILAQLEHSGIARLLDGGTMPDGRPYMVMDFVAGRQITDYCNLTSASLEQRLRLFVQVCDAWPTRTAT